VKPTWPTSFGSTQCTPARGRRPAENAGRSRLYPFLGSYLLAQAVDRAGADLVLHGHAHRGQEQGVTPGGVRVRNVAQHVIRRPYKLFSFGADGADGHGEEDHSEARAAQSSA
jgi:hypothetical protein